MENKFKVVSKYKPTGDQPQAIEKIAEGFQKGLKPVLPINQKNVTGLRSKML